jgi:hypothetical protein
MSANTPAAISPLTMPACNGNTPVGPANSASDRAGKSGNSGSMGASGTGDADVPATKGASEEMKRQTGEPQKAP